MRRNKKAFTLIELIIAIAVLVILTGLLAPQFMKYIENARRAKMMQKLDNIYNTLQIAYTEIPEAAKKGGDDGYIYIQKGAAYPDSDGAGKDLCALLTESLGESEMKKLRFTINFEAEEEYADLAMVLIEYVSDKSSSDFCYLNRGFDQDSENEAYPGTYGERKGEQSIMWK